MKGMAGLVIGLRLPSDARAQSRIAKVFRPDGTGASFEPNAFVRIGTDNPVTVLIKHIEFGQGPFTGWSTLVAEGLEADCPQVRAGRPPCTPGLDKKVLF